MQSVYAPSTTPYLKPYPRRPIVQIVQDPRAPRRAQGEAEGGEKVYSNLQLFHTPGKRFFAETICAKAETQLFVGFETAPRRAARPTALDVRVFVLRIEDPDSGCFSH